MSHSKPLFCRKILVDDDSVHNTRHSGLSNSPLMDTCDTSSLNSGHLTRVYSPVSHVRTRATSMSLTEQSHISGSLPSSLRSIGSLETTIDESEEDVALFELKESFKFNSLLILQKQNEFSVQSFEFNE